MPNVATQQPPFYRRKPSRRALSISAVLLVALLVLIILFDWNWLKGPIEQAVQARTGRVFHIRGNLDVDLGRTTTIKLDDLSFGNAPWSRQEDMASADRAAVEEQIAAGVSAAEAEALYLTDEYFENWYQSLCTELSAYEG